MKKFIILESLFETNPKIGKKLYDEVLSLPNLQIDKKLIEYKEADDGLAFIREMQQIANNDLNCEIMLHLVMHGNVKKDGLVTPKGELISWSLFADLARNVNRSTKNNLFLTMAVCHGAYCMQEIKCWNAAPFKKTIGSFKPIYFANAVQCYEKFYKLVLTGTPENQAVAAFHSENEQWLRSNYEMLKKDGVTDFSEYRYALIDCEEVFLKIASKTAVEEESAMRARFDKLCPEFDLEGEMKEKIWEMFKVEARKTYKYRMIEYAGTFFMTSQIPENMKYVETVKQLDWKLD